MTTAETLRRAFAILACDELAAFVALSDALRGLVVRCAVDGEVFTVLGRAQLIVRRGPIARADAHVVASRAAILDLIDGRLTVLDAVLARRLTLVADIGHLVRLSRAQRAFAEGAARTRQMRALLAAYRDGTDRRVQKRRLAM